jgi:hypothetical protein
MQIRVPTNFEGREFDKSLKLLKSTPKLGQFLGHFCLQSENERSSERAKSPENGDVKPWANAVGVKKAVLRYGYLRDALGECAQRRFFCVCIEFALSYRRFQS